MDSKMSLVFIISVLIWDQVQGTKTFTLKVHENGVDFEEDLRFEGNIQIIDVPAHHDRLATKNVKDISKKLQLQVRWEEELCLVSKIFYPVESEVQIEALEAQELIPVDFDNATHLNIIEIEGPEMDHSEIPHSLRSYCPENFTAKAIHLVDEKNIIEENDEVLLIKDPEMNNDALNNAPAPHVTDTLHFLSRKKRSVCKDAFGRTQDHCFTVNVYCPGGGCPAADVYFRCSRPNTAIVCEYILTCSTAGGPNSEQCLKHFTNSGRRCRPCCRFLDCTGGMERCANDANPICFQEQAAYEGHRMGRTYWVESAPECQRKCQRRSGCNHFNFRMEQGEDEGSCELQTQKGRHVAKPGCTGCKTGPRACPNT